MSDQNLERAEAANALASDAPISVFARLTLAMRKYLARVDRAGWMLLAAFIVLAIFVFFDRLGVLEALLAAFALWATRLVLPPNPDIKAAAVAQSASAETNLAQVYAVADAMVAPTFVLDWKSNILHRNIAASGQLPLAKTGSPITYSVRNPDFLEILGTAQRTGLPEQVEFQQTGDNPQWFRVSVAPFLVPDAVGSSENLLLVVFENQSEQKRVETMRVDFIANASHELRTPLTSVIGFIDTLQGSAADDATARKKFLPIMRSQAERMSNLIEDLMSLSRIELRQHLVPAGQANLTAIVKEVVEALQGQIERAQIAMNVELPEEDVIVNGDRDELYQVCANLLENAIKYGESGKKIDIEMKDDIGRNSQVVRISFTDYGIGIAAEHVPRLTERFYRVDAESSRKKKGTGLGLAIVKHIVRRHRGEMYIKSELGLGTRVEISLSK